MTARTVTYVAWLGLVVMAACGGKRAEDAAGTERGEGAAGSAGSGDAPPRRAALTAKLLSPVLIHEIGPEDAVPTSLVVQVAAPIIDRSQVGQPSPQTRVKISPEVAGTWVHTGLSELTFTPTTGFEPERTYQVEVAAIATLDGAIEPGGEKWRYELKTPAFKFLRWAPSDIDLENHKISMDLEFSAAVLPNLARAAMVLTIDGKPAAGVAMTPSGSPSHVVVALSDPRLGKGSKVAAAIKGTLVSVTGAQLKAAGAEYVVSAEKAVTIKAATVIEGPSGFYLEVVCNDAAARAGNRAYYENEGHYNLSQRCQLTDEAIKQIHFEPAVPKAYITNGRAGFRVFGELKRGLYKMKIDGGATSLDGGVVLAPFATTFAVPARQPQLSFAGSGRYLPRTAWTNLGIKHTNVDSVNLVIRQVPADNLVFWLGEPSDAATERTSDVILKKTIPLRGAADASATSWLDVAQLLPATTKGVLELKLVGVGTSATARLLLTNLSLVAKKSVGKKGAQTVQVWALDMDSADLLGGVDVSLVRQSGKAVARCTTKGGEGCTLASKADADPDDAEPFALIARKGDDLTYLRYQDLKADVAESSTSGVPYVSDVPYHAAVYTDRGVYRPGDTAHVVAIVRDAKDRAPDQALPVDVEVLDPRANVVRKLALKTNAAGVVALDQELAAFADTGHWRVAFSVADKPLAAQGLQVEEFVPERMKVTATPQRAATLVGEPVVFDVSAQYLFGGSAAESGLELTCSVEPSRFDPEENGDLTYGVEPKGKAVSLGENRAQLDLAGKATIDCPALASGTPFTGTSELTATAAVLEAGSGRATVARVTTTVHPEKFYVGLRTKTARAVAGEPLTVEGAVVDWLGKLAPAAVSQVHVELAHLEADYGYGRDDDGGEARYDRWLRAVPEGKLDAKVVGGKLAFEVTPGAAGAGFLIRVIAGKAKTELVIDGDSPPEYYGYGDEEHVDQTPRPAKPTRLPIKLAKEIKVGEPAAVSVRSPYRGKVLWTVETDRLLKAEWRDAAAGETTWSFTLDRFTPNVYVSAFLVKDPHLESKDAFMPDRAFGIASARVAATEYTQAVQIEAPKEVRSSSPLTITLSVGKVDGPAFATVAVVDEGILSLTRFASPDPLGELFAKRALGIETYETIGWTMLHQPAGASSRTGGDANGVEGGLEGGVAGGELAGVIGGGRVRAIKPVAMFSGVVAIGADGKVAIPFQVPQYRGRLRVMAVVATPGRVGRAEAKVTVRDPLVVQVTFPRFVTQHDALEIPVFLTNVSGGPLEVSFALSSETLAIPGLAAPKTLEAPIRLAGKSAGTVKLANEASETVVFPAKVLLAVGGARLRVVAKARGPAGAFEAKDELEVPVLPSGPKERVIERIKLEAGTLDLAARSTALKSWMPTSESTTFWMTNNPYAESFQHLNYLVHYPYGCIEQTASTIRPLLYVAGLAEQVDPALAELKIEDMVLAGINRVFTMQTASGGFGYWPGATEPLEWATAYATDTLLDAKQRGYAVPDDRMKTVLRWIENRVAQYERGARVTRDRWSYYDAQSEAYLHYVLARAGKGKKARLQALIAKLPAATAKGVELEDLYLLKAALFLAGDRRYEKDLKAVDTSPIDDERVNSWSFYSDRRRRGLVLSTFFDLFGNDPAGELLAQRVSEMLTGRASSYYNTQELVWGVTGLGKWVTAMTSKASPAGTLSADGAKIAARGSKHKSADKTWSVMRASEYRQLTLDVPAQAAGAWLVIRSEGVRPNGDYKVGGNGLAISRTYRNLAGEPIDPAAGALKLGDLVFVDLEVSNTTGAAIQNIALVDRLPAGFEVENPRLGRSIKAAWIVEADQWATEFMNMRDDHLEAFGTLAARTKKQIVYTVRVVTSGAFTIPPAEAEAMYDPTLWARQKGGTAVVTGPWTGKLL